MQPDPKTPESEPEPANNLDALLIEAMEGMDLADAGAVILAEAMRMAKKGDCSAKTKNNERENI